MPYHYQNTWRHRLQGLSHTRRRLLLIDCEQRHKRKPKFRRDHRLEGAVVIRPKHNARTLAGGRRLPATDDGTWNNTDSNTVPGGLFFPGKSRY